MEYYPQKRKIEFQVGIFSFFALIFLILSYFWLTNSFHKGNSQKIKVKFQQIQSVEKGTAVTILGLKSGKVSSVKLADGTVLLELSIPQKILLKEGTKFYIVETSLMGETVVNIIPGEEDKLLDTTDIYTGETSYNITSLVNMFGSLATDIQNLTLSFHNTDDFLAKFSAIADSTKSLLANMSDAINKNSLPLHNMIRNMQSISEEIHSLVIENKDDIHNTIKLTHNATMTLQEQLAKINVIMNEFVDLSAKLNADNNINALTQDKKLYEKLFKTTADMDSLILDIKKNPKKYFQVKVF